MMKKSLVCLSLLVLLVATSAAQESAEQPLPREKIESLVSPVALHPDALLSQILMAATYPLEVVEAARWVKESQALKGDALAAALEKKSWDPSVKSLVNFPDVLAMMSEQLGWTQELGNAVLSQQKDVLDAVQRLRLRAQDAGNLETTPEQKVIVEEKVVRIESTKTEVIHVPVYNPTVVYGAWPAPAYPPPPPYQPTGFVAGLAIGFTAGVIANECWGYAWGGCHWGHGDIDIDVNRNSNFNRNINRERNATRDRMRTQGGGQRSGSWRHDPEHRKGVGYGDRRTSERFGRGGDAKRQRSREEFRGRSGGDKGKLGDRSGGTRRGGTKDRTGSRRSGDRGGALGGTGSRKKTRSESKRGRSSREKSGKRSGARSGGRSGSRGGSSRGGRSGGRSGGGRR